MKNGIDKPNKIKARLTVEVEAEFYDDESSEETVRYCVEQDLEDTGLNVIDVSVDNTRKILNQLRHDREEIARNLPEDYDYYSFLRGVDYVLDRLNLKDMQLNQNLGQEDEEEYER